MCVPACVTSGVPQFKHTSPTTQPHMSNPGSIHYVSGHEVDVGGRGRYLNIFVLNLKANFLPLNTNSFHHAKVWSPKTR